MAAVKLTELVVAQLKPAASGRREVFDQSLPAFGLRVSGRAVKSWFLMTRIDGKLVRLTLGRYPALGLAAARKQARAMFEEIAQGNDPRARPEAPRNDTVRAVIEAFLKRHAQVNNRSWRETERIFNFDVIPAWGDRDIRTITRRDVRDLLNSIVERGSPIMANRLLANLRKLFNWAYAEDLIESSPCLKVAPPGKETARDRVLSDDETVAVWSAALTLGQPFSTFVQVLLLTAQRRDEVASMRWAGLDLDSALWTLPREANKGDRVHEIPLAPAVAELLKVMPRIAESPFVFTTTGVAPISGFSKIKTRLDAFSGVKDWRLHDLRRTAATGMARLGIAPHIVEKVLNHQQGVIRGVAAVYNRASYNPEKRAALEAWARILDASVNGVPANVVAIRR